MLWGLHIPIIAVIIEIEKDFFFSIKKPRWISFSYVSIWIFLYHWGNEILDSNSRTVHEFTVNS